MEFQYDIPQQSNHHRTRYHEYSLQHVRPMEQNDRIRPIPQPRIHPTNLYPPRHRQRRIHLLRRVNNNNIQI